MAGENVVYRRATPTDRDGILAVSAHFENDWIGYVIDEALAYEPGGIFVAEIDGHVAAICAADVKGDHAWLQAMRVEPAYQNHGLATRLTERVLEACAAWGCRKARLGTAVTNAPVHHFIGGKLGFRDVGRWVEAEERADFEPFPSPPEPDVAGGLRAATVADLDETWAYLLSAGGPKLLSPAGEPWQVGDLSPDGVAAHLAGASSLLHRSAGADRRPGPIDGLVLLSPLPPDSDDEGGSGWGCVAYLDGPPPVVKALFAAALGAIRRENPAKLLHLSLARGQWERLAALVKPGWPTKGLEFDGVIYEKDLG